MTKDAKSQVKRHCQEPEFTAEVHLRAVFSYLVMRSHVESHKPLEENLGGLVVAKEGISINIVAGFEVKQPKQIKESPEQDMLTTSKDNLDTWVPSAWEEEALLLSRNILGKEEKENREHSTFSSSQSSSP